MWIGEIRRTRVQAIDNYKKNSKLYESQTIYNENNVIWKFSEEGTESLIVSEN